MDNKKYSLSLVMKTTNETEQVEYQEVIVNQKALDYAGLVDLQGRVTQALANVFLGLGKEAVELKKQGR